MTTRKPSFFERLTGNIRMTDESLDFPQVAKKPKSIFLSDDYEDDDSEEYMSTLQHVRPAAPMRSLKIESDEVYAEEEPYAETAPVEEEVAELSVDVFHDEANIYIQTMTAGVKKEDLEITLSREEVIIRGTREQSDFSYDAQYTVSELYWGNFERVIALPDEVDIERAKAHESHGLITLTLPKFDKKRQTVLHID